MFFFHLTFNCLLIQNMNKKKQNYLKQNQDQVNLIHNLFHQLNQIQLILVLFKCLNMKLIMLSIHIEIIMIMLDRNQINIKKNLIQKIKILNILNDKEKSLKLKVDFMIKIIILMKFKKKKKFLKVLSIKNKLKLIIFLMKLKLSKNNTLLMINKLIQILFIKLLMYILLILL